MGHTQNEGDEPPPPYFRHEYSKGKITRSKDTMTRQLPQNRLRALFRERKGIY